MTVSDKKNRKPYGKINFNWAAWKGLHGESDINIGPISTREKGWFPALRTVQTVTRKRYGKILDLSFLLQKWYMFTVKGKTWIVRKKVCNLKSHHSILPHFSVCSSTHRIIWNGIILNIPPYCFLPNILAQISVHARLEYILEWLKITGIPEFKATYSPLLRAPTSIWSFSVFFQDLYRWIHAISHCI